MDPGWAPSWRHSRRGRLNLQAANRLDGPKTQDQSQNAQTRRPRPQTTPATATGARRLQGVWLWPRITRSGSAAVRRAFSGIPGSTRGHMALTCRWLSSFALVAGASSGLRCLATHPGLRPRRAQFLVITRW